MSFTAAQVREIIAVYGKWPDTPKGYEDPEEWRCAEPQEPLISVPLGIAVTTASGTCEPRLILKPKPKRYEYRGDGVPRRPKAGDWTTRYDMDISESMFQVTERDVDMIDGVCLIFRREEIPDSICDCPCWKTGKYVWVEGCKGHPRESMT
jgi:hypothetical protein